MPPPRKPRPPHPPRPAHISQRTPAPPELVDPRWILTALAVVVMAALLCGWGTLCLLWYQGQWQFVFHPARTVAATPASIGLGFTEVHFDDDATGQPQLDGWLIPAATASAPTALMLHGAEGSIATSLPEALALHNAGLNVLLFDYRGFGASTGRRPTQDAMRADADAALTFLTTTGRADPRNIVLYGQGIGASLAVRLAGQNPAVPAIILDAPDGDLTDRVAHDPHSSLVPARLLFHETFPLAQPLRSLKTPKLLIAYADERRDAALFASAANPKVTVVLPSPNDAALVPSIRRFVDLYLGQREISR